MINMRKTMDTRIARCTTVLQKRSFANIFVSLGVTMVMSGAVVFGDVSGAMAVDYTGPVYENLTNSGLNGGAITNLNSNATVSNDVLFKNNNVTGNTGAGAILSRAATAETQLTIGDNVQFIGNSSEGVGALYVLQLSGKYSSVATIGTNVLFDGNTTTAGGSGAVSVYAHKSSGVGSGGASLEIGTGAIFRNNSAVYGGGAFVATGENAIFTIAEGAIFEGNSDTSTGTGNWNGGGAILIQGTAQGTLNGATFTNNTTKSLGGAIRVIGATSTLNFSGTNIFTNNTDSSGFNDIDNSGIINIFGAITFDGGMSGTGTTNFKSASTLTVGENTTLVQDAINVEGGATLVVTKEGTITIDNVTFNNVTDSSPAWGWDGTAKVLDSDTIDVGLFELNDVTYTAGTYTVTVSVNDESVADALGPDAADGMVDFVEDVLTNDPDTAGGDFVQDNPSKVEGAAKLVILGGVIPSLRDVNEVAMTNTAMRTGIVPHNNDSTVSETSSLLAMNSDGAILPVADGTMAHGFGIWFMPMFSHTSANGFSSGKREYGFDANIIGATLGADYTFARELRLGLAFLVGKGSASSKGDFEDTDNNFDYVGVSLYGAKHFDQLGLSFDMNYIKSENDMSQDLESGNIYGDTGAALFTIGAKAEYRIPFDSFNMTPYAGVRFNYYDVDAYDTMKAGAALFTSASIRNTVWEIPVGVTFDTTTQVGSWDMVPSLGLGMKFAMGDLDAEQHVRIAGGTSNIVLASEVADDVTFQGALGLAFAKDAYAIGLNYTLDLSENVESHGLNINLRYEF